MVALTETAYAKINVALHVRRRRSDGYHELETLFAFAQDGDVLAAEPAEQLSLSIKGPFAEGLSNGADNLVLRAAAMLAVREGVAPAVAFTLEKNLPVASGIGGGSADAAAALRLAARLWKLEVEADSMNEIAVKLGADVTACVASRTCFGTGVGEHLLPVEDLNLAGTPILLVNPLIACPTGPVFANWDGTDRGGLDPAEWLSARNDLQLPAIALHPVIAEVLARVGNTAAFLVRMSGSGATCFGLYRNTAERDHARDAIARACPSWWMLPSLLR